MMSDLFLPSCIYAETDRVVFLEFCLTLCNVDLYTVPCFVILF